MMDTAVSTETSLDIYQITRCHMQYVVHVLVKCLLTIEGITLRSPVPSISMVSGRDSFTCFPFIKIPFNIIVPSC